MDHNGTTKVAIGGLLGVLAIASALVLGVASGGVDSNATPLITTVLGFVGVTVMALVGNIAQRDRADKTAKEVKDTAENVAKEVKVKADNVERKIDGLSNGALGEALERALKLQDVETSPAFRDLCLKVDTITVALSTLIEKENKNGQSS